MKNLQRNTYALYVSFAQKNCLIIETYPKNCSIDLEHFMLISPRTENGP